MESPNEPLLIFWRAFGDWGFILVIAGVVGEVLAAAVISVLKKRSQKDLERWETRLHRYEVIAGWILVIGLAMEYHGHKYETQILDSDKAVLGVKAEQAGKAAADAKLLAARTGTTNAQLSLRIEELRKINNDLAAKVRPRLLQFDPSSIASALEGKPPLHVEILYPKEDMDAYDLASLIYGCLESIEPWRETVSSPRPIVENDIPPGHALHPEAPLLYNMGIGYGGFIILTRNSPNDPREGIEAKLGFAISAGFGEGEFGDSNFTIEVDPRLQDNCVKLVVGSSYSGRLWKKERKLR